MKVSNENKMLIGVGVVAVAGLGFLYWKKKQNEKQVEEMPSYLPEETTKAISTGLDRNKLLGKGTKGSEVVELQNLLNVKADGDFGNITLKALQKAKGVSQISLNQLQTIQTILGPIKKTTAKPAIKPVALPKSGAKLMISVPTAKLYNSKKLINGTYSNTGEAVLGNFSYGESAGTFKTATANGTYLVQKDGKYYFVNGKHVKPY
jgi:LPXTG-motif cell wall-anchored protein